MTVHANSSRCIVDVSDDTVKCKYTGLKFRADRQPIYCSCGGKPSFPPLPEQAWNLAASLIAFVADGCHTVSREQYEQRLAICDACEFRKGARCQQCGCNMALKARGRAFTCPEEKWPTVIS